MVGLNFQTKTEIIQAGQRRCYVYNLRVVKSPHRRSVCLLIQTWSGRRMISKWEKKPEKGNHGAWCRHRHVGLLKMFSVAFVYDFPQRIKPWFRQTKTHSLIKVSKILAKPKCFAWKRRVLSRRPYLSVESKHECQVKMQPAFYWNGQKFLQPFQCYSQPLGSRSDRFPSSKTEDFPVLYSSALISPLILIGCLYYAIQFTVMWKTLNAPSNIRWPQKKCSQKQKLIYS